MADVPIDSGGGGPLAFLRTQAARNVYERVMHALLFIASAFSILVTLGIIASLFGEAITFFTANPEVTLREYLTGTEWAPLLQSNPQFGILPLINGTIMIAVLSSLVALPVGLATAIFLSEYAPGRLRRAVKPLLEILSGIPTVVYGYFALVFITPQLERIIAAINTAFGLTDGPGEIEINLFNALSASIVVGVLIIPLVASISEDAMRSVPRSLREGSFALGATQFETATRVVVPAALSGILASFVIAISRAIGETMAVTVAAGATPKMTLNPLESVQTMTAFIVQVSFGDAAAGSINSQSIYAVGATLFLMTFTMNLIGDFILRRFREEYE
ncbi:MAG: phosphate ABC transporter permease subunit PstC [Chloroflexi bacterium]|nr:phosphate ABC transporter permease subunit PstC [Chloroflexota bacterium]